MGIGAAAQPSPANISARVQAPATAPLHRGAVVAPSPVAPKKAPSEGLEEKIGLKWFARIGITIVVLGIALLIASKWTVIPLFVRVLLIYAGGLGILGLGIFAERYDNYRVLGRSLIGGGWATTFTITFAIGHAPSLLVLHSVTADLFLLLMVAAVMVWHTLKYDSQAVTGIAFLLGFASVTLNPDPPYNLIASVLLIAGMTVIVLKRQWFELEVFGILASYLNHLYWLYDKIIGPMGSHKTIFPQFYQSAALVISYWVIFRVSYMLRKVSSRDQENISTVAALLNPLLLLAVLRYQSYQPKWGFTLLLALGAVEFILGQLSVSRRRTLPFYILSSLGATLMVAAVPLRYSGDALEIIWLAGAEVFLLAGIFAREKLFHRFGWIISFLVAAWALPLRLAPLAEQVMTSQPHHSAPIGLILAAIAAVLYANSHVIARVRADLFADELDKKALRLLSFVASAFAVGAIYSYVSDSAAAVALALFVVVISWLGRQFRIAELVYQAHWIAAVAFCDVVARGQLLETSWHAIPSRVLTFGLVATCLYVSSRFVRFSQTEGTEVFAAVYAWAGSALLALLIWFQAPAWLIPVFWIALGLALSLAAQAFKRDDLKWQALALVLLSFGRTVWYNFDLVAAYHQFSLRLISVSLVALGIYLLARWSPLPLLRPAYSLTGTFLLALLAYKETPAPWTAVAWIVLALLLSVAARWWKDRALLWQTHVLAALAAGWTLYANFAPQYRGGWVQLVTVAVTGVLLYVLTWSTNIAGVIEDARISYTYSWAGSLLLSWLAWFQLKPENVSLAWAAFGLALFEIGTRKSWRYLRPQAYVALVCSFAHVFYANFNVPGLGAWIALVPAAIYFVVYWQLHEETSTAPAKTGISVESLLACLGTATVAAVVRFEAAPEIVATGYAAIVIALLIAAWRLRLQIFMYQALVMLGVTAFRISMHNFYSLKSLLPGSLWYAVAAIVILAAGIPIAFAWRNSNPKIAGDGRLTFLVRRPEQPMFFVPVVLMAVLLAIKMPGGMITLAWGAEGVFVFLLALIAKERSFRLAGLGLLMVCVVKILCWDAWQLHDTTARYLTLIGVGAILLVVSFLYGKNRKALQDYL